MTDHLRYPILPSNVMSMKSKYGQGGASLLDPDQTIITKTRAKSNPVNAGALASNIQFEFYCSPNERWNIRETFLFADMLLTFDGAALQTTHALAENFFSAMFSSVRVYANDVLISSSNQPCQETMVAFRTLYDVDQAEARFDGCLMYKSRATRLTRINSGAAQTFIANNASAAIQTFSSPIPCGLAHNDQYLPGGVNYRVELNCFDNAILTKRIYDTAGNQVVGGAAGITKTVNDFYLQTVKYKTKIPMSLPFIHSHFETECQIFNMNASTSYNLKTTIHPNTKRIVFGLQHASVNSDSTYSPSYFRQVIDDEFKMSRISVRYGSSSMPLDAMEFTYSNAGTVAQNNTGSARAHNIFVNTCGFYKYGIAPENIDTHRRLGHLYAFNTYKPDDDKSNDLSIDIEFSAAIGALNNLVLVSFYNLDKDFKSDQSGNVLVTTSGVS